MQPVWTVRELKQMPSGFRPRRHSLPDTIMWQCHVFSKPHRGELCRRTGCLYMLQAQQVDNSGEPAQKHANVDQKLIWLIAMGAVPTGLHFNTAGLGNLAADGGELFQ